MYVIRYLVKNERNRLFKINLKMHTMFILVQTSRRIKNHTFNVSLLISVYDRVYCGDLQFWQMIGMTVVTGAILHAVHTQHMVIRSRKGSGS
jgi:hypothetical protein